MPKTSMADFEALVRRAGLPLTPEEIADLYQGWAYVEPMLDRVRTHGRAREAEPAHIFRPEAQ